MAFLRIFIHGFDAVLNTSLTVVLHKRARCSMISLASPQITTHTSKNIFSHLISKYFRDSLQSHDTGSLHSLFLNFNEKTLTRIAIAAS